MMTPTIHLNGTSGLDLIKQQMDAVLALDTAYHVLADAAPNARDYYPQGPDAYSRARDEHNSRMQRLGDIIQEITQIWESLQ